MPMVPKAVCRFDAVPARITVVLVPELEQVILQFVRSHRRLEVAEAVLRKNDAGGILIPDSRAHYRAVATSTVRAEESTQISGAELRAQK